MGIDIATITKQDSFIELNQAQVTAKYPTFPRIFNFEIPRTLSKRIIWVDTWLSVDPGAMSTDLVATLNGVEVYREAISRVAFNTGVSTTSLPGSWTHGAEAPDAGGSLGRLSIVVDGVTWFVINDNPPRVVVPLYRDFTADKLYVEISGIQGAPTYSFFLKVVSQMPTK